LFLFSDTGGGHRSAAEAIIEAIEFEFGDAFTTEMLDFFKSHADGRILKAQQLMEESLAAPVSIDGIASEVALSPRHFKRRFKSATGDSPLAYLQNLRVETAKKHLEGGNESVNEIAYKVGYEDVNSFRKVFKKIAGMSPKDYRSKFSIFAAA